MTDEQPRRERSPKGAIDGVLAFIGRHRTGALAGALTAAFLLLAGGAFAAGVAAAAPAPAPSPKPTGSATPTARPTPGVLAAPTRVRTCSVADELGDSGLPDLGAMVLSTDGSETLLSRRSTAQVVPGATTQLLTAAAALAVLGPDYRMSTTVLDAGGGAVALVGHGDATLSSTAAGTQSVYQDAPKLATLAASTVTAWATAHPGQQITSVALDSTWWSSGDAWDPDWDSGLRQAGYLSDITALQVDGDRADPTQQVSPRTDDPVEHAGAEFLAALHAADPSGTIVSAGATAAATSVAANGTQLASIDSQPVGTLVPELLSTGDATLAEMLARVTSVAAGGRGTSSSLSTVLPKALDEYGVDTSTLVLGDGSGTGSDDRVTPAYLAGLLVQIAGGGQNLDVIRQALPIAGKTGSLATRFTGASTVARSQVSGLAGSPPGGGTVLAGLITGKDGAILPFAFASPGDGAEPDAIDALATAVYRCGDNLSDH